MTIVTPMTKSYPPYCQRSEPKIGAIAVPITKPIASRPATTLKSLRPRNSAITVGRIIVITPKPEPCATTKSISSKLRHRQNREHSCLAPYICPLIFGFSNRVSGAGCRSPVFNDLAKLFEPPPGRRRRPDLFLLKKQGRDLRH